jgi:hypothetical protein
MSVILNLKTNQYFIANDEIEQNRYLTKMLNHQQPPLLEWKCNGFYTSFKSVIRWNRTDKIIIVPSEEVEQYIFENKNYEQITLLQSESESL